MIVNFNAVGTITEPKEFMWRIEEPHQQITYNPYKYGHFYRLGTEEPVFCADIAFLTGRAVYIN